MAAAGEERDVGIGGRFGGPRQLQVDGEQMPVEMVHADDREVARPRERARRLDAGEKRADEPGALGHGDRVDGFQPSRRLDGFPDDGEDRAEVRARGQLGDDAAIGRVEGDLGGDHVRQHVAFGRDDRRGGLVTGRLDAQYSHRAHHGVVRRTEKTPKKSHSPRAKASQSSAAQSPRPAPARIRTSSSPFLSSDTNAIASRPARGPREGRIVNMKFSTRPAPGIS